MSLLISTLMAIAALSWAQDPTIARCGPWYQNQACPFNANGLGGELFCTKFGFCSSTASDGSSGVYTKFDGDCVSQADMNGYCNQQLAGSTCSFAEKRCQISGQDPKKFNGLSPGNGGGATTGGTTGGATGTTGTTSGTTGGSGNVSPPATTSSSTVAYPMILTSAILAWVAATFLL